MSDETIEAARSKAADRWPAAEEAFAEGLRIRSEMWGADATNAQIEGATGFTWPLQDAVTRWCFGETWSRDELDPATRSMVTLAALMAIGQFEQVKIHTRGAIANGVTPEQIRDVLLHTMIYVGVPRAVDAFAAARSTLLEMGYEV
ncbi:MAG TPA: carboxymuconolactone decarboxylase family protein [Ilumatobacter sp.]|nr:carboxymuconolactone decarboxylase family protein [Ilumatobacter sp.]